MKLTNKDMSVLIGLLLGDGYIDDNGRIGIEHCEKQKDYCIFKAKLLHSVCGGKDIVVHEYVRNHSVRKDGKEWKSSTSTTYSFKKQSRSFIPIRNMLYGQDRRKHITEEILSYLDPCSIALWWMDDGNIQEKYTYSFGKKVKCGYNLRLYTYLSKEENELIRQYFIDNYNMYWNIVLANGSHTDTQWVLRCGVREGRKFLNIIREYIREKIPSMAYKVIDI